MICAGKTKKERNKCSKRDKYNKMYLVTLNSGCPLGLQYMDMYCK